MMSNRSASAALLASLLLASCGGDEAPVAARPETSAEVITVSSSPARAVHAVPGTVRSENASTLSAAVVGAVTKVTVREGDRVRTGQPLVEIEAGAARAELRRGEAGTVQTERAIEAAAAAATLADVTFRRYSALRERGSVSAQELDEVAARRTAARAELARLESQRDSARAGVDQASAVLALSTLRAPFDGVITARFVDPGAQAAPGLPLLRIESTGASRVDATVPEYVEVAPGDEATIRVAGSTTTARVTRVQPSLDAGTRTALVQLETPAQLRAGSFVTVEFAADGRNAVFLPTGALIRRGQLESVFVVDADGTARMRLVTTGDRSSGSIEILSGLRAGERVVLAPGSIREGTVVRARS